MDYQNVRGTQDFLPEQESVRRKIRRILEDTFIRYGCKPIETPIINYTELMASKYAGGAEILQEMYTLTDRGERDLALRYDLTIPFAKVVAMNPQLAMPFKRYEIGKVFRDGPIKAGRFREFTQCDVDIVGVESQAAEAELMMMAMDAFEELAVPITIQYNNRKLLYGLLQMFEVPENVMNRVILILDKMEKINRTTLVKELKELSLTEKSLAQIEHFLDAVPSLAYFENYQEQNRFIAEGVTEVRELMDYLQALQIDQLCIFNPFLARGLEIYTGTIYEIFLADGKIKSSIGSGGRYDNAIGGLIGTDESFATVGISFGLDVIYTALDLAGKVEQNPREIDIYIIPMNTEKQALQLASFFRKTGKRVEVELSGKKVRKAMDKANRENVGKVIVLGENEINANKIAIKDMESGCVDEMEFKF
ncbi:histidine--tRNA ligase [Solibacillus sp. FSL H8-0523]|uniref:histidine--tRNA ligase n=1 Tax=Solibacillus sp. FSL H8-0523 TaxID=2954511 RepID=UPI0031010CE0